MHDSLCFTGSFMKKKILIFMLIILILGTLIFRLTDLDRLISSRFFRMESGWFLKDIPLVRLIYHYGSLPAFIMFGGAGLLFILSFIQARFHAFRKQFAVLILAMLIGPGFLINGIFKPLWGRPRPRQISEFSGDKVFLPVWQKGPAGNGKSFPSGHASMGFFLLTPFFLCRKNKYAVLWLCTGIFWGAVMGLGRVAQGGHWASDVFWSWGFVWLTGWAVSVLFRCFAWKQDSF